jgi:signal transduction histidine kinase
MLDESRLRRVLEIGSTVVSELDLEAVLHRVLEEARELTGARYAALGVLDADKEALERFITVGTSDETRQQIGDPPHGRGILGLLIREPRPLRLADLGSDPRSYGFPPGHPPMGSFLGVPIVIRGEAYGNLYLTDKQDADVFDADDEEATELLAGWAAIAIDNARAYSSEQQRRVELEQAVHALEATTAIARALGGETDLDRILELIVHRARALLAARNVVLLLTENDELRVRACAGPLADAVRDIRIPIEGSVGGEIVRSMRSRRIDEVRSHLRFALAERVDAEVGVLVPLVFRGRALGVLEAFDREDGRDFSADDEQLLVSFAASAATAVATAQTAANEALRRSMQASERERSRWARELHDDTLQQLAGLKMLLSGARRQGSAQRLEQAVGLALDQIDDSIAELRRLIVDLRPAALDDLGLADAVESLVERVQRSSGLKTTVRIDIGDERLPRALEDNAYRIVQEALTNVVKHAGATRIDVTLQRADETLGIGVVDDGSGLDPAAETGGFGLIGMRERVALASGTLQIAPGPTGGTAIDVRLPVDLPVPDALDGPGPDRAAGLR